MRLGLLLMKLRCLSRCRRQSARLSSLLSVWVSRSVAVECCWFNLQHRVTCSGRVKVPSDLVLTDCLLGIVADELGLAAPLIPTRRDIPVQTVP